MLSTKTFNCYTVGYVNVQDHLHICRKGFSECLKCQKSILFVIGQNAIVLLSAKHQTPQESGYVRLSHVSVAMVTPIL